MAAARRPGNDTAPWLFTTRRGRWPGDHRAVSGCRAVRRREVSAAASAWHSCGAAHQARGGVLRPGWLPIQLNVLLRQDEDVETLAEAHHDEIISRLIAARATSGASSIEITGGHGERFARLFMWSIASNEEQFARYSWWQCLNDRVGLAGPLEATVIEQAIKKQALKLPIYREATRRVALLLVVDSGRQAGMCGGRKSFTIRTPRASTMCTSASTAILAALTSGTFLASRSGMIINCASLQPIPSAACGSATFP